MATHLHADDNVYDSLAEAAGGEERWAFGTGFDDPLAGVDTTVPDGVDAAALARQCLALGDDALILSQRLAGWVSNAHELEDEVALANIALDLLGQARLFLSRAGQADPTIRPSRAPAHIPDEDALAYFRDEEEFTNVRLVEREDTGDFARCIARLFVAITWRLAYLSSLSASPDPVVAAIAAKAVIEMTYHREYAAGWLVRLGDGTPLSHRRMQDAVEWVWPDLDELFVSHGMREETYEVLRPVLVAATLAEPAGPEPFEGVGGRMGRHTDDLDPLLADLQDFARANPEGVMVINSGLSSKYDGNPLLITKERPDARAVAETVTDPELPMLTLHDLGVLRDVRAEGTRVVVSITPTYSGCPAMTEMRADLTRRLRAAGYDDVEVRTELSPPWTSDDITEHGRRVLAEHGIAPPGPAPRRRVGPVPLTLGARPPAVACPQCGSADTVETSRFGSTACKALYRCRACAEPFEHLKAI